MSYTDDIRYKLRNMHTKTANEDIYRIMDALKGDEKALCYLLNFVNKWDEQCRKVTGLKKTLDNIRERQKRGGGYI